jgi:hypothetical protein
MNRVLVLLGAGLVLVTACAVSLWRGKTIGLYGVIETPVSIFYWIIVITYGVLGVLCLISAIRS